MAVLLSQVTQQFKPLGNYQKTVKLGNLINFLEQLNEKYGIESYPYLERGYKWSIEKRRKYVEYLLRGGKQNKVICFNCPTFGSTTASNIFLIDGKQRLSAILMFLTNELDVFDGYVLSDFEDSHKILRIEIQININNMQSKEEILDWYYSYNTNLPIHSYKDLKLINKLIKGE